MVPGCIEFKTNSILKKPFVDGYQQATSGLHDTHTRVVFIHVPISTSALSSPILNDVDGR